MDEAEMDDAESAQIRTYSIANPSHPLEISGPKTIRGGVVRTVDYLGDGSKLVIWDFTDATY